MAPKEKPFYYIHPAIDPAIDLWENPKAVECMLRMSTATARMGEDLSDWEIYNRICTECEDHDTCYDRLGN